MADSGGYIQVAPLEFNDFSGGLTENFFEGDVTRYARADNFYITIDKKLEVRPGTVVYDPIAYTLPGNSGRIAGLFVGISETILFAHANRDIYTQSPDSSYGTAWAAIKGPTGNEALSAGTSYNLLSHGEFQRQVYYTSDAQTLPGKVFRDETNTWKAVTAGLPKPLVAPTFPSDSSIIQSCILLANAIRSSMILHFSDAVNLNQTSLTFQHRYTDKYSLSYFQTQTFNPLTDPEPAPSPIPTPAPGATDLASLQTLCVALATAYEHHRNDSGGPSPATGVGPRLFHQPIVIYEAVDSIPTLVDGTIPTGVGIHAKLSTSGSVTQAAKIAGFLNDLAQKWYWHQLAPFAHAPRNDYSVMSRYLISVPKIPTIYTTTFEIQIAPNYVEFCAFAYWLKMAWNNHASGRTIQVGNAFTFVSTHVQPDIYGPCTIPNPTDFDSAALVLFWIRWSYGKNHVYDSNQPLYAGVSFNTTSGSPNLTSVQHSASAYQVPLNGWIQGFAAADGTNYAQISASGTGTASLTKNALLTASAATGFSTLSWFHGNFVNGTSTDTTTHAATQSEFLGAPGSVGNDLSTWILLGQEFSVALATHSVNANSHPSTYAISNDMQGAAPTSGNPFYVPTVATYAYALFYKYVYTVERNGIFYEVDGPPIFSASTQTIPSIPVGTIIPTSNATYFPAATILQANAGVTLSGIPSLVNTKSTNYDTNVSVVPAPTTAGTGFYSNFTIELYRTTDGGTTFYYLDSLVNLTAGTVQTYTDLTNENYPAVGTDALNDREVLYTSGGVVANDPPPQSKYVLSLLGFMYYGGIIDTGQFFPQRLRQSIQGEPDSAPATFFDDMEDEITGLSSTRSNLIALCKSSVYRVSGSFTSTGQGSMSHERISDSIGCLNALSVVRTEIGVFFAGSDGFYYTDGFQLIKISIDLNKTYLALTASDTQKARIYGCYDKLTRRVWWALKSNASALDNDVFFTFYLDYGVKPSGVFTKSLTTSSWLPASACFYKGQLIIGDTRGYLLKTDPSTKTDPKIDTTVGASAWNTVYIPWDFRTCALDFGTTFKRKWITKIHSMGQNVGNSAIQLLSINDNNDTSQSDGIKNLPPIQYLGNPIWGDARVVWGDSAYAWKYDGKMDVWRRFPSGSMRSDLKQVAYTPGNFVVYKSDNYPPFSFSVVDATLKTATITTPTGFSSILWPLDVVDMYLSFDLDGYVNQYLVLSLDTTKKIITFQDTGNLAIAGTTYKWQITGIKKEQRVKITAFDIHFSLVGDKNQAYPGKSGVGGQGANS